MSDRERIQPEERKIIVFPDFEDLKKRVEQLRIEMSMLVLERDELQFVECKNIEMKYMLELGGLEYKAYEAQCAMLRLKRKIELIQAKINRQEKIMISQIEYVLDKEFAQYQEKLDEQIDKVNDAIKRSEGEVLSEEAVKELKKRYRHIVKTLHPDLHPDITPAQIRLFENAVTAYKNGDLEVLRIIDEMVTKPILTEGTQDAIAELRKEKERLEHLLKILHESIAKIKSEYPYTMKELIHNQEKITARKAELNELIREYQEAAQVYKRRIKEMLR